MGLGFGNEDPHHQVDDGPRDDSSEEGAEEEENPDDRGINVEALADAPSNTAIMEFCLCRGMMSLLAGLALTVVHVAGFVGWLVPRDPATASGTEPFEPTGDRRSGDVDLPMVGACKALGEPGCRVAAG